MRLRAKPWSRGFLGPGSLGRLPAGLGLEAGHPLGAAGLGPAIQGFNPPLQLADDRLLPGDDRQQDVPAGGPEISVPFYTNYMT